MREINVSIGFDKRLWRQDLAGSKAHAEMLKAQGIVEAADADRILAGLAQVEAEFAAGGLVEDPALEDIHMHAEARLTAIIGPAAGRLHTARSRNDQVATDFRLWVRDAIDRTDMALAEFQQALVARADEHAATVMPGFTHLQVAQPVTLGHHLMAYYEMAARDRSRFADARRRLNESPLGSAALAGTSFPLDRAMTAAALGFDRPTANSLDSVSDRDFALEALSAASICGLHLSRLAEEIVLWASQPFGFVSLPDAFSTGSSIMPQKRNPDAAELVRGHSGRLLGAFQSLAVTMKGLPLAYSKDMQDDKEPVFEAFDKLHLCLAAMAGMVATLTFRPDRMRAAASAGFSTATDLADWLVREGGVPFREAHHVTGRAVKAAEEAGCRLDELPLATLQAVDPRIDARIYDVLSVDASVASRTSHGGTAPSAVRAAVARARTALGETPHDQPRQSPQQQQQLPPQPRPPLGRELQQSSPPQQPRTHAPQQPPEQLQQQPGPQPPEQPHPQPGQQPRDQLQDHSRQQAREQPQQRPMPQPREQLQQRLGQQPREQLQQQPGQQPREQLQQQPGQQPRDQLQQRPGQQPREQLQQRPGQQPREQLQQRPGQQPQQPAPKKAPPA